MNARALTLAVLMVGATSPAWAQMHLSGGMTGTAPYLGANIGLLRYDESGLDTITPSLIFARVGLPISSYFALEARLGTGLSHGETHHLSVDSGLFAAGYLKGSIALTPGVSLYAVAGLATDSLHRNFGVGDRTDSGFSAGLGGDIRLTRNLWLNFEWTHLPGGTNAGYSYNSNLISAGITFPF